ncbi:MAG: O-antigen ligase family protein [Anaerolineae bacterium]|nr:O-antigen ligase family protein [Anaerolineae bacterium]
MNHFFAQVKRLRPLLWLILLLAIALIAQATIVAHQARVRGIPGGFPAPVAGAGVPMPGVNVALEQYDSEALETTLTRIEEGGFTWVRQPFYWSQIEPEPSRALSTSKGQFDWSMPDRTLAALARHPQLQLVAVLDDDPPVPPDDPNRFAEFAAAFAARYGAQVNTYQIWDEPNLADHWGGGPVSPPAYADLLARAANAIRASDPDARIILAGLAPTVETGPQNLSDVRYLEQLYQAGAAPYFDIVAGKPYGFYTGPDDRRADESVLNFSRLILLREVMVRYGDTDKAVWASHWGWNALPPGPSTGPGQTWSGAPSTWGQTDAATQAAYTVAALERARAEWPWAGAMILEHFQPAAAPDDPHWGFALVGQDDTPRPVYDAVAEWTAALPDAAPVGGYLARNPWAIYAGDWRVGDLGADVGSSGDRATFRFAGPSVALTVRRGPYRAFLYVTVDGEPANALPKDKAGRAYVVLYDDKPTVTTVPLATGLPPGQHTVEIVAEGGQGQWALVDWRVGAEPIRDGFAWQIAGLATAAIVLIVLLTRDARRVDWAALKRIFLGWPEWVQVMLTIGLVGLLWVAAAVSWGRDWGSPWFVISLSTLPALAAFLALRLDLGLALVALTAPFYSRTTGMLYWALSLPEVLVVLCGIGAVWQRRRRVKPVPLDWAVLSLVVAAIVAGLAAEDKPIMLFELRAIFLLPALYYALLRLHVDDQTKWQVIDGFILGAVGMALVGLVQYALGRHVVVAEGGLPRMLSIYPSPNNVGLYLGRVWPLLVAIVLWMSPPSPLGGGAGGEGAHRQTLYALALLPVTLAMVLSFSRGALLLAVPAAILATGWRAGGRWRWAALTLVALGALVLIPLLNVPRFASLLDLDQGGTFFRIELWQSSLALIRDHPWFGVGPGNFLGVYRTRYVLPSAWQEFDLEHPHNVYLDHWTRLGVLGVLAGAGLQITFWRAMRQRPKRLALSKRALALGLAGSMAALLAHGLVDNSLFFPDLALAFFLTLALAQRDSENRAR